MKLFVVLFLILAPLMSSKKSIEKLNAAFYAIQTFTKLPFANSVAIDGNEMKNLLYRFKNLWNEHKESPLVKSSNLFDIFNELALNINKYHKEYCIMHYQSSIYKFMNKVDKDLTNKAFGDIDQYKNDNLALFNLYLKQDAYQEVIEMHANYKHLLEEKFSELQTPRIIQNLDELKAIDVEEIEKKDMNEKISSIYKFTAKRAIVLSLPAKFCWRNSGAPYIPTKCPNEIPFAEKNKFFECNGLKYTREEITGIECYQDCLEAAKIRYNNDPKKVAKNYTNIGGICHAHWEFWKTFILSYEEKCERFTNWSRPCDNKDHWHYGGLCYIKNCEIDFPGMKNCGLGACSFSKGECKKEIINMISSTLSGIGQFALFILSLGSSSPLTTIIKTGNAIATLGIKMLPTIGKTATNFIANKIIDSKIDNEITNTVKKKGSEYVKTIYDDLKTRNTVLKVAKKEFLKSLIANGIEENAIKIWEHSNDIDSILQNAFSDAANQVDFLFDLNKTVEDLKEKGIRVCEEAHKTQNSISILNCAKFWTEIIGNFDPTGLVGIAAAYMHPKCEDTPFIIHQNKRRRRRLFK